MPRSHASDDTAVLVVGAGPVGLAAAFELGTRGIECVVVEPRREVSWDRPRAKTTSARTMEHLRRWGIADALRAAAFLPVAYSDEVVFCTSLLGTEITRFSECFALTVERDDRYAEAGQQIPQPRFEEVLRRELAALPSVHLELGWRATALAEGDRSVEVTLQSDDGATRRVTAQYVIGSDGPRSVVRRAIDAEYAGTTDLRPNLNLVFRAPGLHERHHLGRAIHYWVLNPRIAGVLGPMDTDRTWWVIASGEGATADEPRRVIAELVGADVDPEIVSIDPWAARMALSSSFGRGRVFLAGDAAHLNPPWGGHGFNTGVGDAVNLGWKIAAVLDGWGGSDLLDSYEVERRPIAAETVDLAAANMAVLAVDLADPLLMAGGEEGEKTRRAVSEEVRRTKSMEFHSLGLVLGYSYAGSPIVAEGARDESPREVENYRPEASPGARLPHRWLDDGRSLYDALGSAFTLVSIDGAPCSSFAAAAAERRLPLSVVGVERDHSGALGAPLVLVRPDQHVAWRGADGPQAAAVLDRARGVAAT